MTARFFSREIVPDVEGLLDVIRRRRAPGRVHHLELFLDPEVRERVAERFALADGLELDPGDRFSYLRLEIRVHAFLGYEVFHVPIIPKDLFPVRELAADDTADRSQRRDRREWMEEHGGPIRSWRDFEAYPWPDPDQLDFSALEWLEKHLPENMGCYDLTAHILELLTFLMGYETLCYKIYDEPDLVDAICRKVGEFSLRYTELLCQFRCVRLIWGSDDMGFRSSTMVSPEFLKAKVLPWHRACAEVAHRSGWPYLLHACGNLGEIMEELIDTVRIDGKHSFEDAILPVGEAYRRYRGRLSILGGVDVDYLCRSGEAEIRSRVRDTLERCFAPDEGKGYCLGTGNTVANYIPLDNYLVMLDEGRRYH